MYCWHEPVAIRKVNAGTVQTLTPTTGLSLQCCVRARACTATILSIVACRPSTRPTINLLPLLFPTEYIQTVFHWVTEILSKGIFYRWQYAEKKASWKRVTATALFSNLTSKRIQSMDKKVKTLTELHNFPTRIVISYGIILKFFK